VYEWASPHGYRYRIDHTGTHPLGKDTEAWDADPRTDADAPGPETDEGESEGTAC
jgi:hypothetical protein